MTQRRRGLRIALAIAAAVLAALAAIAIGVRTQLPSWLRGTVERSASQALGRELTIAGPFDLTLSLTPRVVARDVRLANVASGSEPTMLRAERVTVVLDLVSLWSGPLRVRGLEIENARLILEADGEGRGNWLFARAPEPDRPSASPGQMSVDIDRAAIRGFELVYRPRPEAAPVTLAVAALAARLDPASRSIELDGSGRFAERPWEIAGRLGTVEQLLAGGDIEADLTGRLGETKIGLRGTVRDALVLGEADLEVSLDGPDIAAALQPFGWRSPLAGGFELRGHFAPAQDGIDVDLQGAVGGVSAKVHGIVSSLGALDRFDLALEGAGPDAAVVGSWIGVRDLPAHPFDLAGRLRRADGRLFLDPVQGRVGSTALTVAGEVGSPPRFVGTDLVVEAAGGDLSELSPLTHLRLPAVPFEVAGRFLRRAGGLALDGAELHLRDARIRAEGDLGEPPRLSALDLAVEASGPDLAFFSEVARDDLPPGPFALLGRIAREGPALRLAGVEGRLGDDTVKVSGRLVPAPRLAGSDLELRLAGPDFAKFAAHLGFAGVPSARFDLQGRLRVEPDGYLLDAVEAAVGPLGATLEGRIGWPSARNGTAVSGRVSGAALADLAAWGLPGELPAEPFSIAGRIRMDDGVCSVDGVVASVGADRANLDGVLGALPDLARLDATAALSGPSFAGLGRFFAAAGLAAPPRLPAATYALSGRVRRAPPGYELHEVRARVGETTARLDGTLGAGPELAGSELRIDLAGPDLAAELGGLTGLANLPAAAFELSAEVSGSRERFASKRLSARLGANDLAGSLTLRLDGRPFVDADLRAQHLDLPWLLAAFGAGPQTAATAAPAPLDAAPPRERVLSDEPLRVVRLRQFDAKLRLAAAEMVLPGMALREVVVAGELRDGALRIDRFEGRGSHGGHASASFAIEPRDEGYRLRAAGRLEGGRLVLPKTANSPESTLPLDLEVDLSGAGRSPHEIAASGEGEVLVVVGSGRISNTLSDRLAPGVLRSLLDALNPFRKSSDHTEFDCGIASAFLKDGTAIVEPIALRTDKMTVVGHGDVDFATEDIDLYWTVKPRKGLGLSASSIANPYIRLGGTLASPSLDLDPLKAVTSTGAAVATAGLTILSKGLYNRITAEKKVCVEALAKARKQMESRRATPGS